MILNSLKKDLLIPKHSLYLIKYSQNPNPIFTEVTYNGFDSTTGNHSYSFVKNDKKIVKKLNSRKAKFRLFTSKNEMIKSLFDCFVKRNIALVDDYKKLVIVSQEENPEFWI